VDLDLNDKIKENNTNDMDIEFDICNLKKVIFNEINISQFDICKDYIIFSTWDSNKIFAYSKKFNQLTEVFCLKDSKAFVIGIVIISNPSKSKYLAISTSEGILYIFSYKQIKSIVSF